MREFTRSRLQAVPGLPDLVKVFTVFCVCVSLFCTTAQGVTEQGNAEQMRIIWRHAVNTGPLPLGCHGTPAVGKDGTIYVPAGNFLYALTPDGSEKWSQGEKRGLWSVGDVAIDDEGTVYTQSNALSAYRPDGSLKWRVPTLEAHGWGHPSVAIGQDQTIYFSRRGKLCAVGADGVVKWEGKTGARDLYPPVIDPLGTIYCNGPETILAFGADGKLQRGFRSGEEITVTNPFEAGIDQFGNLYFAGPGKKFYAVDNQGQLNWTFKTDYTAYVVYSTPAVAPDGTIYFGCNDSHLYAVSSTGELKWKFRTEGVVNCAPAIDSQGNIYFTSRDRNLLLRGFQRVAKEHREGDRWVRQPDHFRRWNDILSGCGVRLCDCGSWNAQLWSLAHEAPRRTGNRPGEFLREAC